MSEESSETDMDRVVHSPYEDHEFHVLTVKKELGNLREAMRPLMKTMSRCERIQTTWPEIGSLVGNLEQRIESLATFCKFLQERADGMNHVVSDPSRGYVGLLPEELLIGIFRFLSPEDVSLAVPRVCKQWSRLSSANELWLPLVQRYFPDAKSPLPKPIVSNLNDDWFDEQKDSGKLGPESPLWLFRAHWVQYKEGKIKNGPGTYKVPAGHYYSGDWVNDEKHGKGTFCWVDQRVYEGEWKNDKRDGYGKYYYANQTLYEGQWKEDKRNGIGTYSWPDGRQYTGEWINHRKNGRGIHIWSDGSNYVGHWVEGSRNGHGIFTWADGRRYEGNWHAGKIQGFGVHFWTDGDRFEGTWIDGKRSGSGKLYCKDGTTWDQNWNETKFNRNDKDSGNVKRRQEDEPAKDDQPIKRRKRDDGDSAEDDL